MQRKSLVDAHVGKRVRLARLARNMSQTALGDAAGVTFQQIQKYEHGTNRVSAGRLTQFARVLGVDIRYFFEGADGDVAAELSQETSTAESDLSRLDLEIAQKIAMIKDRKVKRALRDLLTALVALADDGTEQPEAALEDKTAPADSS